MDSYILDTNLFFNMEEGMELGAKTEEVVMTLTKAAKRLKETGQGMFYLGPRVVEEFLSFFEDKEQPFLREFLASVTIQSPDVGKAAFPAQVFYRLVDDIRGRSYRGLRIGEEEIHKAGTLMQGKAGLSKKEFEMTIGEVVKKYRERYRQATRTGFLDSLADLDSILLAKELNGILVSTDEGVLDWGRVFGVKEMPASVFGAKMRPLLQE